MLSIRQTKHEAGSHTHYEIEFTRTIKFHLNMHGISQTEFDAVTTEKGKELFRDVIEEAKEALSKWFLYNKEQTMKM